MSPTGPDPSPAARGAAQGRVPLVVCSAIALAALALRLHGIGWGLPEVFEEAYPFKEAWEMWGWGPQRGLDLNPHFFKYPSLTLYLQFLVQGILYVVMRAGGIISSAPDFRALLAADPTPFYRCGRAVTALFGAATVFPAFELARRAAGPWAAVVAGALVAVSMPLIAKSQVIEVDVPLAFFVTLGLLGSLELFERPGLRKALTAGVVAGLAASTKYPGLILALPVAIAPFLGRTGAGGERPRSKASGKIAREKSVPPRRERHPQPVSKTKAVHRGPARIVLSLVALGGLVAAFSLTSPFVLLDRGTFLSQLAEEREHMAMGHFGVAGGASWWAYARAWFGPVAGWPMGLLSLAGLAVYALGLRRRWAILIASFLVPYYAIVGSWSMKADRYLLPLLPATAVVAASAIADAAAALRRHPRGAKLSFVALPLAGLALAWPSLAELPRHLAGARPDTRALARRWIETHVPEGSFVVSEFYGPSLLSPLEASRWDPEVREALARRKFRAPLYAVQQLPMYQVEPERSARFYDPRLYPAADAVIVTSSVRDRYRADPVRFAAQLAFYDTLEARFARAAVFDPFHPKGGAGPEIVIYRNPARNPPFARRASVAPPESLDTSLPPAGGEPFFYYNLGLNYEWWGRTDAALRCYQRGLSFTRFEPRYYALVVDRMAEALTRRGAPDSAMRFLAQAESAAPSPAQAEQVRRTREWRSRRPGVRGR